MYESRKEKLIGLGEFSQRVGGCLLISAALFLTVMTIGVFGYHYLAGLSWIDSLLNAAMIATGMGPVSPMNGNVAKVFATCYALLSGLVFMTGMAIVLSPIMHRILHKFHLDEEDVGK